MSNVAEYLGTVLVTAMFCGIARKFLKKDSPVGQVTDMICAVAMVCCVLSPVVTGLSMDQLFTQEYYSVSAESYVEEGAEFARKEQMKIINSQCAAYVLDKAEELGLGISVELTLCEDPPYAPSSIRITGAASPFAKRRLMTAVENDLGIPKEEQIWIDQ